MSIGTARPHLGSDPDRLHNFLRGCTVLQRGVGMALNAIGALRDMSCGDRNKLFGLSRQCPVCEDGFAEGLKCGLDVGCEFPALVDEVLGRRRIHYLWHAFFSLCFLCVFKCTYKLSAGVPNPVHRLQRVFISSAHRHVPFEHFLAPSETESRFAVPGGPP